MPHINPLLNVFGFFDDSNDSNDSDVGEDDDGRAPSMAPSLSWLVVMGRG